MVLSRCAVLVASGLSVSWAARIARGRHQAPQQQKDCCSIYDGMPLVQLNATSEAEHTEIYKAMDELQCTDAGEEDFMETMMICSESSIAVLKERFERVAVVEEDAGDFLRRSSGLAHAFTGMSTDATFYSDWRDYEARLARVQAAVETSEGVATIEEIGQSIEGRPIFAVRLTGASYVSGGPRVVANFQQHAREWISGMTGVYAVEQAIAKAKAEPQWLENAELVLVPVVNPDGTLYSESSDRMWRKNRRPLEGSSCIGVDTNRNWPPGWIEQGSKCGQTWAGTSALSEPETQALSSIIDEHHTTIHMDVHSYSQLIVVPFGYTQTPHPQRAVMDEAGLLMQQAIRDTTGVTYQFGGSELIGWSKGIARDYNAGVNPRDAFGFLFELRPGRSGGTFAPPASEILPCAQEFFAAMVVGMNWAMSYEPPAPTPAPPPGTWELTGSGCVMDGDCVQSKNYPQNYGNNEQCSLAISGDISISVEAFSTESRYDILTMGGSSYSGTSAPPSGSYSGSISWTSDYSVVNSGWRLCRQ